MHKKQAEPLSSEQENELWNIGAFGMETAQAMLNTGYFYNCKLFGLRGVDEHRQLDSDQFLIGCDQNGKYIEVSGRTSKNFAGGLRLRNVQPKLIRHHSGGGNRCLVEVYARYISLVGATGPFYKKPIAESKRFSSQVLGVKAIGQITKNMCKLAGFKGNFTSHTGKNVLIILYKSSFIFLLRHLVCMY